MVKVQVQANWALLGHGHVQYAEPGLDEGDELRYHTLLITKAHIEECRCTGL